MFCAAAAVHAFAADPTSGESPLRFGDDRIWFDADALPVGPSQPAAPDPAIEPARTPPAPPADPAPDTSTPEPPASRPAEPESTTPAASADRPLEVDPARAAEIDASAEQVLARVGQTDDTASASATAGESTRSGADSWLRSGLSLLGVIGLILLLAWGYRLASRRGDLLPLPGRNRRSYLIDVVARKPLTPKQSLALVRLGPRLVLVGVGPERVSTLDVIDDPKLAAQLLGEAARDQADSHAADFSRTLEEESRTFAVVDDDTTALAFAGDDEHDPPEPAAEWQQALARLRRRLKSAS
jgi:flagellar biogenesis protein FliO